jgi:DnaJ-domain-containing protein 1
MLGGIQNLLSTSAGLKLTAEVPSFQAVRSFSPTSDMDLRAMGALGAHLPSDFEARLTAALSRSDSDALASLTRTLSGAYQEAVPEVAKSVQSRAQQVVAAVAYGQIGGRDLVTASNQLGRFDLYGPSVRDKSNIVRRLASQQIMERAQKIAADFLRFQRSAGDERARTGAQDSAGTYNPGGQKKIPEAWKLHAYQKAAGTTGAGAGARAEPAQAEPKAKPMSADLYERIGVKSGATAAQIEAAYRRTADQYRPERYIDRDAKSIIVMTMAFQRIEEAFAVLGDPAKRAEYDRGGAAKKTPPAANPLSDNFYERIGTTKDASQAEIKAAYRRAAAAFHPDKSRSKDEALVKAMTKAFQDVGEAYATLGDPPKRAAYDRKLASGSPVRSR